MLLARTTHVVQKDGVHHDSEIYFADELWGMVGEEVEVAHMPHDRRWIEIFHQGRWLATAYPSSELDEDARVRALERRREDEKALRAWARRARRRAQLRVAPITAPARSTKFPRSATRGQRLELRRGDVAAAGPGGSGQPSPGGGRARPAAR